MHHDAGRNEHEPALRQPVPTWPEDDRAGDGQHGEQPPTIHDWAASSSGPAISAGAQSTHVDDRGQAGCRPGPAAGNAPRRRMPTPAPTGVRTRRSSRPRRRSTAGPPSSDQLDGGRAADAGRDRGDQRQRHDRRGRSVSERTEAIASPSATTAHSAPAADRGRPRNGVLRPSTADSTAPPPMTATSDPPESGHPRHRAREPVDRFEGAVDIPTGCRGPADCGARRHRLSDRCERT